MADWAWHPDPEIYVAVNLLFGRVGLPDPGNGDVLMINDIFDVIATEYGEDEAACVRIAVTWH
jgi:hypothetical protein